MTLSIPMSPTSTALAGLAIVFVVACACYPSSLLRWFQRKRYQYEVTFALYMLTPTEKFIFNSVLFLFLSMVIIAVSLYLPRHVSVISHRAYYYLAGDFDANSTHLSESIAKTAAAVTSHAPDAVQTAVDAVKDAVSASNSVS